MRELDTARALLRQSAVLSALKVDDPERYLKLEHLVNRPYFEAADAWPAPGGRDARRRALAAAVAADVAVVPSSRLLALVGQALKWQQHTGALPPGTEFDLFRAAAPARRDELEAHPTGACRAMCPGAECELSLRRAVACRTCTGTVEAKCIRFGKKSHAEVASFSPDGQARGLCIRAREASLCSHSRVLLCTHAVPRHGLLGRLHRGVGRGDGQAAHRFAVSKGGGVHDARRGGVGTGSFVRQRTAGIGRFGW